MQRAWLMPVLFAFTLFLGSFLLFLSQPIQGKMLLPWLGGTPAVWSTCMLFFQAALLLAYLYAHIVSTRLRPTFQVAVHAVVLLLPLLLLPVELPESIMTSSLLDESPLQWLLVALSFSIGPAFFAVAATSPLLQSWFFKASKGRAVNPYALYAAGNFGSLLALLGYPLLVEPGFTLGGQTAVWAYGYVLLAVVILGAGAVLLRANRAGAMPGAIATASEAVEGDDPLSDGEASDIDSWTMTPKGGGAARDKLYWMVLGAIPSSLMLGVTTFLTTDIASIPMLWVLPLALYTLSFVMVFARYGERSDRMMSWVTPLFIAAMLFLIFTDYRQNLWMIITLHLAGFFAVAVACHGRLALSRPVPQHLTSYYFCMALGGVLGGAFNTLLAPLWFTRIAEYPLALVAAAWLARPRPRAGEQKQRELLPWLVAASLGAGALMLTLKIYEMGWLERIAEYFAGRFPYDATRAAIVYGTPLLLGLALLSRRRPSMVAGVFVGVVAIALSRDMGAEVLHKSRSFFGVLTVRAYDGIHKAHTLVHGGILHGEQWMSSEEQRAEPRSYYHREGPLGQIMKVVDDLVEKPRIAAIGLGTGAIAAYGHRDNTLTFYELDPHVERLARNPRLFTYVDDCIKRWCNLDVVLGDGRLKIAASNHHYDLIVVDAFSSDAIPVHLITLEAVQTYFSKLTSAGLVAFHISNRYVDLEPVLLNIAEEVGLGYAVRSDEDDELNGKGASTWVILAANDGLFEKVAMEDPRWRGLEGKDGIGIWRDDYANVARSFTWY